MRETKPKLRMAGARKRDSNKSTVDLERTALIGDEVEHHEPSDLRGDRMNIGILFFLYLLQGIPLGLTAAIPMLLQNRGASYKQQAEFSFATWPFSMKLLWAPIVDALYWTRFGRRKSWLIPTQYLIGGFMLILSLHVNKWLIGDGEYPNVQILTFIFFCLNFLAATQDIAVDGWALTMLKRCNVGHASTCNSVGQTAGYFLGYVAFMALESKDFCNTWFRSVPEDVGLVTLPGFLWFWGYVFLGSTTLVAIFKHEHNKLDKRPIDSDRHQHDEPDLSIKETYSMLWSIIRMRPIQILVAILMTVKISFAACDAVTSLKLVDAGVPKDKLAMLVVPLVPLQILLPLVISKHTAGPRPMNVYVKAIPYRLLLSIFGPIIVYWTPTIIAEGIPYYFYGILLVNYGLYQITLYSMFVAIMAFFARISDPILGGTYMTMLNTVCNLGGNWPNTAVLWLVDVLTYRECVNPGPELNTTNVCLDHHEQEACASAGGTCQINIDGYYVECIICLIYGCLWYKWGKSKIQHLQKLPPKSWHVVRGFTKRTDHSAR